jgi:hypothetical protein
LLFLLDDFRFRLLFLLPIRYRFFLHFVLQKFSSETIVRFVRFLNLINLSVKLFREGSILSFEFDDFGSSFDKCCCLIDLL